MTSGDPLLQARALVLLDLAAQDLVDPHTVSIVEDCVAERRWWLSQWPQGWEYVDGLVAQDVQDSLFEESKRWPVCSGCPDPTEHSLTIDPELGADPRWVCSLSGSVIAHLGALPKVTASGP
ncbi:MAG: hypothetical protein H0T14_05170 [Nocardioidaceae bacterium]|nr:hypothetical protein [Nocardioidaceae bacterium]